MLIITGGLSVEENKMNFQRVSVKTAEVKKRDFFDELAYHLQFPLILLQICDDATGLLACRLLREVFGADIADENVVKRIDGASGSLIPGALVLHVPRWGLCDRSKMREDETPYQYILRLWEEDRTSFEFVVTPKIAH